MPSKASMMASRSWPPRLFISRARSSSLRASTSRVTAPWSPISSRSRLHHAPAEIAEQILVALPQPFADHGIEALAVVIDDPPAIAQAVFPAFEDRFEDIALIELGIAKKRDHAAFWPRLSVNFLPPTVRADVILHQRREQRLRHAKPDRAGREIDIVGVLGARRIGLRALIA